MSYTKQNFQNGQILKAEHLNYIENGITNLLALHEENYLVKYTIPAGADEFEFTFTCPKGKKERALIYFYDPNEVCGTKRIYSEGAILGIIIKNNPYEITAINGEETFRIHLSCNVKAEDTDFEVLIIDPDADTVESFLVNQIIKEKDTLSKEAYGLFGSLENSMIERFNNLNSSSFVTPEAYGAIGDGTTDDTFAIQEAINSGKKVIFANKKYAIYNSITIPGGAHLNCQGPVRFYLFDKGCFVLTEKSVLENAVIICKEKNTVGAIRIIQRQAKVLNCRLRDDTGEGMGICFSPLAGGIPYTIIRDCYFENFKCAIYMPSPKTNEEGNIINWISNATIDFYSIACRQACIIYGDGHQIKVYGQSAIKSQKEGYAYNDSTSEYQIFIEGKENEIHEMLFDVGLPGNCNLGVSLKGSYNTYIGFQNANSRAKNYIRGRNNRFLLPSQDVNTQTEPICTRSNWFEKVTEETLKVNEELTDSNFLFEANIIKNCLLNKYGAPFGRIKPAASEEKDTSTAVLDLMLSEPITQFIYTQFEFGPIYSPYSITIELIPTNKNSETLTLTTQNFNRITQIIGTEELYNLNSASEYSTIRFTFTFNNNILTLFGSAAGLFN